MSPQESNPSIWSSGRYDTVGDRIAPIAADVVAAAKRRGPFGDVVDLACGTGNAALVAAHTGARVTAVDLTQELIAIAGQKSAMLGHNVNWVVADAAETGLSAAAFDAAVSNMGTIFAEPAAQVAETARLLRAGGVSRSRRGCAIGATRSTALSWRCSDRRPPADHTPDKWGDAATAAERLSTHFDDIQVETGTFTWQLGTAKEAVRFVTDESPTHVSMLATLDDGTRRQLIAAYEDAFRALVGEDGQVTYAAPYAVVTAVRR